MTSSRYEEINKLLNVSVNNFAASLLIMFNCGLQFENIHNSTTCAVKINDDSLFWGRECLQTHNPVK